MFVNSKVKNGKLYLATFAAVLGPLSFGFVLGYSSPAIPELSKETDPRIRLDDNEASWFGVRMSFFSQVLIHEMILNLGLPEN